MKPNKEKAMTPERQEIMAGAPFSGPAKALPLELVVGYGPVEFVGRIVDADGNLIKCFSGNPVDVVASMQWMLGSLNGVPKAEQKKRRKR